MNCRYLLALIIVFYSCFIQAQNIGINNTGAAPANGAALDVDATDKGLLIPRLTNAQRNAIAAPAEGLFIYNTTANKVQCWNGTQWIQLVNTTFAASNPGGASAGRQWRCRSSGGFRAPDRQPRQRRRRRRRRQRQTAQHRLGRRWRQPR